MSAQPAGAKRRFQAEQGRSQVFEDATPVRFDKQASGPLDWQSIDLLGDPAAPFLVDDDQT